MAQEPSIPVCGDVNCIIPEGENLGKPAWLRVLSSAGYGKVGAHTIPPQCSNILAWDRRIFSDLAKHESSCRASVLELRLPGAGQRAALRLRDMWSPHSFFTVIIVERPCRRRA